MNKFFVIAVLAIASCQCQIIDPGVEISRLSNIIKSAMSDLSNSSENFIAKTKSKWYDSIYDQVPKVWPVIRTAVDDTINNMAAAKNAGKHPDHCYKQIFDQFREAPNISLDKIQKCLDDKVESFNPLKEIIDAYKERGNGLSSRLKAIRMRCVLFRDPTYVDKEIPAMDAAISNYQLFTESVRKICDSMSSSLVDSISACVEEKMSDVYSDISAAKVSANECIRNS